MPRARNLKPSFFKNEQLADLGPEAQLLFSGLWCLADRRGRLEDRPKRIKAEVFPYYDVDCDSLLSVLHEAGFITRYIVDEIGYIHITTFEKHQNPHKREVDSIFPPPPSNDQTDEHGASTVPAPCQHPASPADSLNLIPDSLNLIPDSPYPEGGSPKATTKNAGVDTVKLAEFVVMQKDDHSKLIDDLGEEGAARCIEILNSYKGATGKRYKSDYWAIMSWAKKRLDEERKGAAANAETQNPFLKDGL